MQATQGIVVPAGGGTGLAEDPGKLGHGPGMFVDPAWGGKGVGSALVEAVAAWACGRCQPLTFTSGSRPPTAPHWPCTRSARYGFRPPSSQSTYAAADDQINSNTELQKLNACWEKPK